MKSFLIVVFLLLFFGCVAEGAVPDICGSGLSGATACANINDADADGYPTSVDADDTKGRGNHAVIVGTETTVGCSAGQKKVVGENGAYGACEDINSSTTYFIDPINGNDSYDGTAPTYEGGTVGPWEHAWMGCYWYSGYPTGHNGFDEGDTVYLRAGTYDSTHLYSLSNAVDGSTGPYFCMMRGVNNLTFKNYPDELPTIDGETATPQAFFKFYDSSGTTIEGLEMTGGVDLYGAIISGNNYTIKRNYIHDIDLVDPSTSDNQSAIVISGASTSNDIITHNIIMDVYATESPTDADQTIVVTFQRVSQFRFNTIGFTAASRGYRGFYQKHAHQDTVSREQKIEGNIFINIPGPAVDTGNAYVIAKNNRFVSATNGVGSAFVLRDGGSSKNYAGCNALSIKNNTSIGIKYFFDYNFGYLQCGLDSVTINIFNNSWNLYGAYTDYQDNGQPLVIDVYASDADCGDFMGAWEDGTVQNNCYNNENDSSLYFGYCRAGSNFGGAVSLSTWQGSGYETGSCHEDTTAELPQLVTSSINCSDIGWDNDWPALIAEAEASTGRFPIGIGNLKKRASVWEYPG